MLLAYLNWNQSHRVRNDIVHDAGTHRPCHVGRYFLFHRPAWSEPLNPTKIWGFCNGSFIIAWPRRTTCAPAPPCTPSIIINSKLIAHSPPSPGPAVASPSPVRRAKRETSINNGDVTPAADKADHRAAFAREADRSTTSFRSGLYTAEKPRQLLFLGLGVIAIIYTAYKREVSSPEHASHPLPAALAAGAILFLVYCSLQLRDGGCELAFTGYQD